LNCRVEQLIHRQTRAASYKAGSGFGKASTTGLPTCWPAETACSSAALALYNLTGEIGE
jgi:hypothetical protein